MIVSGLDVSYTWNHAMLLFPVVAYCFVKFPQDLSMLESPSFLKTELYPIVCISDFVYPFICECILGLILCFGLL